MKLRNIILVFLLILSLSGISYAQNGWKRTGYIGNPNQNNPIILNDSLLLLISEDSYSASSKIEIYNIKKKPAQLFQRWEPGYSWNFAVSIASHSIVLIDWKGNIEIYDYMTGNLSHNYSIIDSQITWNEHQDLLLDIDSNSIELVIYFWRSNTIQRWNIDTKEKILDVALDSLNFPDKTYQNKINTGLIYSIYIDKVKVFSTKTGSLIATQIINQSNTPKSVFSYDENNFIYIDNNSHIKSINPLTGILNYDLPPKNSDGIINFCETNNGNNLIVHFNKGFDSTYFLIYDIKTSTVVDSINITNIQLENLENKSLRFVTNDLSTLVLFFDYMLWCGGPSEMPGPGTNIGIYNLKSNKLSEVLPQGYVGKNIERMAFSKDGTRLLIAGSDSLAVVWIPDSEKVQYVFQYNKLPGGISNTGNEIYYSQNDSLYVYSLTLNKIIDSIYIPYRYHSVNLPDSNFKLVYTSNSLYIFDIKNNLFIDSIRVDSLFSNFSYDFEFRIIDNGNSVFLSNKLFEFLTLNLNTKEITNRFTMAEPLNNGHYYRGMADYEHLMTTKSDEVFVWNIPDSKILYEKNIGASYGRSVSFFRGTNTIFVYEKYDYIEDKYQSYGLNLVTDKKCYFGGRNYPIFSPNGLFYANWECPANYYYSKICDDLLVGVDDEEYQLSESNDIIYYDNTIKFKLNNPSNVGFSLYNSLGNLVYHNNFGMLTEGSHTIPIDNFQLVSGLYILRMMIDNHLITKKVIIIN